ncbi:nitronate monooxygenase [Lachnospira multipara]|uniref:Probable nitronate monooxygenase n=1 Tax=Lachnospira multipara TaxID=28051 RepID=A0A1H5UHZ6_9FIRM|nr:nitronate monooxygenase [Lachnospira multipara]SEF74673.1 enoyl-[acyl-carrier protein] reductase II [Lachnospira multipara]
MKLLNEILNIKYPIIQGAMANIATGQFAADCSNAGALGIIAAGGWDAAKLEEEIHKAKKLTDKPFGVNLMHMNPHCDEMAELVCREKISLVTTGAGNPGKYMDSFKEAGIKVFPVVASVMLAKRMIESGADAIIAEGTESGGHVGEMTTMTLVPQMVDAVDVPVIAAGGIADGRQFAAALSLGACGAQIGTSLLVSNECPIHENYKKAIIEAKDNGTIVTGRSVNAPVRILKNKMAREYTRAEKSGATRDELEKYTLGSLRKAVFDGNVDEGSLMSGQVCGQLNEIKPLETILEDLMKETKERLNSLSSIAV